MAIIIRTDQLDRKASTGNLREWAYNGLDCAVTLEIVNELRPLLDNISGGTYGFSRALQAPVLEMSMRGLRVDLERRDRVLGELLADIERMANDLDEIIRDGIGTSVSWRSPKQLMELLYGVLKLPPVRKKNANGAMAPTVNRDALERLQTNYLLAEPICTRLLLLRDLDKQRQFLVSDLDTDGRIRTSINIAGTNTGRLSCSISDLGTGANLQTVDSRLRSIFIADEGMEFINVDIEQGDSRNVGAICWNTFLASHGPEFAGAYLDACESGDLHSTVSRMVWPDKEPAIIYYRQDSYRQISKKLGHGTVYFGTPRTMAKHSKVDVLVINEFQANFFEKFPAIGVYDKADHHTDCWHNRVRRALSSGGQITTMLGRRRYFYGHPKDDETVRAAIAYEPQSLTADEIDTGMLALWRANIVQLMLQVHDSLLLQGPRGRSAETVPKVLDCLRVRFDLVGGRTFNVAHGVKIGLNWGDFASDNPLGIAKWHA